MTNTQAWDYAIGLIKVDGLEPTDDFKKYIEKEKRGATNCAGRYKLIPPATFLTVFGEQNIFKSHPPH